jgi:hypothetical protein
MNHKTCNALWGSCRAFVTDLNRTVGLRFSNRTVVVSLLRTGEFAAEISKFKL